MIAPVLPSIMKTVLVFVYSNRYTCANRIDGVRRYADKAGWRVQVIERNGAAQTLDVEKIVEFWRPAGVVAECGGGMPEISRKTLGELPVVYLDEDPGGKKAPALFVNSDSVQIGEEAARELLAMGLPNYAFIGWREDVHWSRLRRDAFERAVKLHGCRVDVFAHSGGGELRRREKLRRWLKALPKPCGLFAVNDPVGAEALELAALENIDVPGELAVIAVDNDPVICERTQPSLSSIGIDFEYGGYLCAELLDRAIHEKGFVSTSVKYGVVDVVRRESMRRGAHADRRVAKAVEFIRRNSSDNIGTDEVAKVMGLSRRMAQAVFKKCTLRTIHEELTCERMKNVERLLRNPRQDIGAIAGLCGWSSGAVLRKLFKETHDGLSMREWRFALRAK